ncbi:hypothetical protein D3C81_1589190 [compost metagenome]
MVRNSSLLTASLTRTLVWMPNRRKTSVVMPLSSHTSGNITFCSGASKTLLGKAMRSGYNAAKVFGNTSANSSTANVRIPVAIATPKSPYRRIPTMVASAEARMLTRLLPISTRPIRRSGFCSSFSTRRAERLPCLER